MGIPIGGINGVGPGAPPPGNNNGGAKKPPEGENDDIKFPDSPFPKINPGNPFSWYSNISTYMSGLNKTIMDIENKLTESVLGGKGDPNLLRDLKFRASAVLGKMYDLLKYLVEWAKQNKESEKDTIDLAFAAK